MQKQDQRTTNFSWSPPSKADRLLQAAYLQKVEEHIPLIIFLCIIAVVGLVGNVLTIIFFSYRMKITPTITLIRLLAITDLIVCLLCFMSTVGVVLNINFTDEILCKVLFFIVHWSVVSSVFTLWIISIDRYRRICRPFGRQLNVKSATVGVFIMSAISLLYSTRDFITYSPVKVNISTFDENNTYVTGHYCTNTDNPDLQSFVIGFHIFDGLLTAACLATFVFTYGKIWQSLRKHQKQTGHLYKYSSTYSQQSESESNIRTHQTDGGDINDTHTTETSTSSTAVHFSLRSKLNTETADVSASANCVVCMEPKLTKDNFESDRSVPTSSKTSRTERTLTIMMSAVTVGFVLCFVPYFIVAIGIRSTSATTEDELHTGIEFALRSPFLNSVINPIIFCFCNTKFRRYVKHIFTRCQINK